VKTIFIFFIVLPIFNGCQEDKFLNDNQAVQNINKEEYLVELDTMPLPEGGIQAIQSKVIYPPEAMSKGIEGKVIVQIYIDSEGKVRSAEIIKGVDSLLDKAAIDAVAKVKFSPGYKDDKAVNSQAVVPIVFKLSGDKLKESKQFKKEGDYYLEAHQMPNYLGGVNVVYPPEVRKAGIQGKVVLKVYVNEEGSVYKAEVEKGVTPLLDKAATDAVMQAKFTPGVVDGKQVKTIVTFPIQFKLQ